MSSIYKSTYKINKFVAEGILSNEEAREVIREMSWQAPRYMAMTGLIPTGIEICIEKGVFAGGHVEYSNGSHEGITLRFAKWVLDRKFQGSMGDWLSADRKEVREKIREEKKVLREEKKELRRQAKPQKGVRL